MQLKSYMGVPASPGSCVAEVFVLPPTELYLPEGLIDGDQVDYELERLSTSIDEAIAEVNQLKVEISTKLERFEVSIFDAHLTILQDIASSKELKLMIKVFRLPAEMALKKMLDQLMLIFQKMTNPYMQNRDLDLKDVFYRILKRLIQMPHFKLCEDIPSCILVANEMLPSQMVNLNPNQIKGIILSQVGAESHTAILARSLGIPMIVGVVNSHLQSLTLGMIIKMDGQTGSIEFETNGRKEDVTSR